MLKSGLSLKVSVFYRSLRSIGMKMMSDSLDCTWESKDFGKTADVSIMTCSGCKPKAAIAGFDLDGTIITTKSGRTFPLDQNDWKILFDPQVKQTLKRMHFEEGYKIVFFTNQAGMATGKVKKEDFQQKVNDIVNTLEIPIQLFAVSSKHCVFRKPRTGSFELLEKYYNGGIKINRKYSFYCGDAAGRQKIKGKKDFSCSDRLFALNLGLKFHVPEELFLNQKCKETIVMPEFDPKEWLEKSLPLLEPSGTSLTSSKQEVVIMVGVQGSGKSFLAENHLAKNGYTVISNDQTGSRDKSLALMEKVLKSGKSVVIDNTHVDAAARKRFIDMANKYSVSCRCFLMNTSKAHVDHNIVYREITDDKHVQIGKPLINGYYKNFEAPTVKEGFNEIVKVNIVPEFKYEQHRILYQMYLVEK